MENDKEVRIPIAEGKVSVRLPEAALLEPKPSIAYLY